MTFQPILPLSGYAGWGFLQRTLAVQQETHATSGPVKRDTDYFAENIGKAKTAEDLVGDRRLLAVALGAFGLDADINNTFFIRKVLEEGTADKTALANKLSDKSYLKLCEAFGFGQGIPARTQLSGFADEIVSAYRDRQFEIDVGDQNTDYRLALNAQRELAEIAGDDMSDNAKWYTVMGSEPLRSVFETAFGLPDSFGNLDVDRQMEIFRDKTQRAFGFSEVTGFSDPDVMNELVRTYLVRSELKNSASGMSSANIALSLLSSI
ncbi:DUF1217 domain-containing protein [Tropicimonas sp. IMCC34043]|uniref:DUF1217 domain-containing protein n=1 Tax=Tropicimonas sp. IMCC34043 TaxID=2248760 RepID=UPI000E28610F|nr:DUF1217 domain-containing protein [Tropicimonas sp. IMCC34043]